MLPAEIAGRRTAVFGISGSGKSNTATVIIEGLLAAGEQVVLIDPKGEGWGLLSLASGKPSNLDIIIFGEPNGHIETLAESHGPRIADFVVESGQSVVLSMLGFESDQSERRFVASFLRQLYRRKSKQANRIRTLVAFEEAHLFVPESAGRGFKGDAAELAGAAQRIVRQGRTFGIGSLVIDQRPQDVAKRVITQCDTIICHQLTHKTDRDALRDWVRGYDRDGEGEKFLEALASLREGEAWIWSPAWLKLFQRIHVHRRKTFDSGAAPDGSAAAKTVQRATVDLEKLRGQLAEVVESAKANDPRELKREIERLKKESDVLARANIASESTAMLNATIDDLRAAVAERDKIIGGICSEMTKARALLEKSAEPFDEACSILKDAGSRKLGEFVKHAAKHVTPVALQKQRGSKNVSPVALPAHSRNGSAGSIPKGEAAILTALIQFPEGREREALTVLTTYARSTRDRYIQLLQAKGYAEAHGNLIVATEAGRAAIPNAQPLPTGESLRNHWIAVLPLGEKTILSRLIDAYPASMSREELTESTGYARSTRDRYLQMMAHKQLFSEPKKGEVRASDLLFD